MVSVHRDETGKYQAYGPTELAAWAWESGSRGRMTWTVQFFEFKTGWRQDRLGMLTDFRDAMGDLKEKMGELERDGRIRSLRVALHDAAELLEALGTVARLREL